MPPAAKPKSPAHLPIAFWDASALVPLCCWQIQTKAARQTRRLFPQMVVWWGTSVECTSALRRLERAKQFTPSEIQVALHELDLLRHRWIEIAQLDEVRDRAEQLLGKHDLRAADSLQLAAALVWCNAISKSKTFVCGDSKLSDAAGNEGFTVIKV